MTARTEDLETLLARIPDPAIRALFSPEFILCAEHFDRFTIDSVLRLVHDLDLDRRARGAERPRAAIVGARGFAPRAEVPLAGSSPSSPPPATSTRLGPERPDASTAPAARCRRATPTAPRRRRAPSIPRSLPAFAVVRAMVEHVPAFLRGEKTGEEILFSPARLPLWFDYFSNDNLLYQINNRLGAEAVARALPATRRGDRRRDRRRLGLGRARRSASGWRATPRCRASGGTSSPRSSRRSCAAPSARCARASRSLPIEFAAST